MKSIKPGRGPSKLNMVSSIAVAAFGVFWCIMAVSMGAVFMLPFGIIFVGMAIYNAIYSYHNLTGEDRYSVIDIVDETEESDPYNRKYGKKPVTYDEVDEEEKKSFDDRFAYYDDYLKGEKKTDSKYCPYCGNLIGDDYAFCPKCGKKQPE